MLTDAKIRKAKPRERDYKIGDSGGLFVLVRANGSKLWRMKYRLHGREKLLSFGSYPEIGLAAARAKRDEAKATLADDRDPSLEKHRAKLRSQSSAAHTFESFAQEWLDLQGGRWTEVHTADVKRSLERDVYPILGRLPLAEIDEPMVLDMLQKIERRGAIETAKRVRQRVSAIFSLALSRRIVTRDPAAGLEAALRPMPKKRKQPAVTDLEELRDLLDKTEGGGAYPVTILASRFLALTAQRPGSVRRARWEDMHGLETPDATWRIPSEQMKLVMAKKGEAAFDHPVPLAPEAVDVLRTVRRLSGRGELVFPGQRHAHKPLSENAIGYLYNRAGWHGRHVPHGWRAAFSTIMNERAEREGRASDRAVIDLMLAHVNENKVEGAYNRAAFMERRREIAEEWAALLLEGARPAGDLIELARRARHS